jgi:Uma2 family endonuclease
VLKLETDVAELAHEIALISAEDYLTAENDGAWRHEFVNGVVYAMVGSSDQHNFISGNFYAALLGRLPARCDVFLTDMKLRIRNELVGDRVYYPDVFVSCVPSDRYPYTREEPVFVAEVLSPHTERIDRGEKFEAYKSIASLQEYAILSQDRVRLELFRRRTGWQREVFSLGHNITFESVDITLPLITLYRRTDFEQP